MSAKVKLDIVDGPMRGKTFSFEEHDTFLFGREADCHACLPDDPMVSRHHFIMEVNPPDARIRDLGSLNGTFVNGLKCGGRERGETPEEGAKRQYSDVDLKDGDQIKVGQTVLVVHVEVPAVCCECGNAIPDEDRSRCAWIGGTFICASCKEKLIAPPRPGKKTICADCGREIGPGKAKEGGRHGQDVYCEPCWEVGYHSMLPAKERFRKPPSYTPVRCQKCGKDVSKEAGHGRRGDYICESCRRHAEADPAKILLELLLKAGKLPAAEKTPSIKGYEIEKRLGVGGFGAVYLARRKEDDELVAIKVMLSEVAVDQTSRQRFLREIELMKHLKHQNLVSFFDCGSAGSAFYVVMEYCDRGGVDTLMAHRGGKLSLEEGLPIMLQALKGLGYVHNENIVHRDLKPANILLKMELCSSRPDLTGITKALTAKVGDLGLAKNFQKAGLSGPVITKSGTALGTRLFIPREQLTNFKYVKPVSDVWSMGATFYNMLTGQFPRDFPRGKDPLRIILYGKTIPIRDRDPGIPKEVAKVIDKALDDNIKNRYQTADEFRKALEQALPKTL